MRNTPVDSKICYNIYKNKNLRSSIMILMLLLTVFTSSFSVLAADTIIVDDDGTADYSTIQEAINNAGVGDTIVVNDGTYGEQITIPLSIDLVAAEGDTPLIYVTSYSIGIEISAPDVHIDGFTIYGNTSIDGLNPSIKASSGSDGLIISNNKFKAFSGEKGSLAILISDGVTDVEITNNTINGYYRGVSLEGVCWARILSNVFTNVTYSYFNAVKLSGTIYYGSIQQTIDLAGEGASIYAYAGLYNENILIDKSLTLRGVQNNVNPVNGRSGGESIIEGDIHSAITISAGMSNVIINGFTLQVSNKSPSSNEAGIMINKNSHDITISNNIITNISDGTGADTVNDETYGIMTWGRDAIGGQYNISISRNLIYDVEEYGIALNDNTSRVIISENKIINLTGADHSSDPIWDPSWPDQICSALHLGGQVGPIRSITISDNSFITNTKGDGVSSPAGGGISFAGVPDWADPLSSWEGFEEIEISGNTIKDNSIGILFLEGTFNSTTVLVSSNAIFNNSLFGVENTIIDSELNATSNFWGDLSGPYHSVNNTDGTGNNVTDNVIFWPWYEFDSYSIKPVITLDVSGYEGDDEQYVNSLTTFICSAIDNESGIRSFTYQIWTSANRWSEPINYTAPFKLTEDGKNILLLTAVDNAGTVSELSSTHYLDSTGPYVYLERPNGGEFIRGDITVEWEAADELPDQQQVIWNGSYAISGDYPGHIQSFMPTEPIINSVNLLVSGDDANITVILFNEIDPVPTPIAEATKHVNDVGSINDPEWIGFPFDDDIEINPEQTYYVGVTQKDIGSTGFRLYYYNSSGGTDPYVYGHAWVKKTDVLESLPDYDWAFKSSYWDPENVDISIYYSFTSPSTWTAVAADEENDGSYIIDTSGLPDSDLYKVRVIAEDKNGNTNSDESQSYFVVDNSGVYIQEITISDRNLSSTEFTTNGDTIDIEVIFVGEVESVTADLSSFGKGTAVEPNGLSQTTANWRVDNILCVPSDGPVTITISAYDPNGDLTTKTASIEADNSPPTLTIIKPRPGFYFMDGQRLMPFAYPFCIGQVTIETEAEDLGSGVSQVRFYIDDELRIADASVPYEWTWDEAAIGYYDIEVVAVDTVGHSSSDIAKDVFLINFDIFG